MVSHKMSYTPRPMLISPDSMVMRLILMMVSKGPSNFALIERPFVEKSDVRWLRQGSLVSLVDDTTR